MHQDAHHNLDIAQLAKKYFEGTATEEEMAVLHQWYLEADETDAAIVEASPADFDELGASILRELQSQIQETKPAAPAKYSQFNWKYLAAAVVVLIAGTASFWLINPEQAAEKTAQSAVADKPPGGDGAILTLSNNRQLNLDELSDGVVIKEKGIKIVKKGNEVSYTIEPGQSAAVGFNTISTSKGQKFNISLPDGTIASLDAASSLQFPASFDGKERKVFVSGQVYFDVAKKARQPFIVSGDGFQVNVLGTRFNVHAYPDESNKYVTLLQGSVQLSDGKGGTGKILSPGNQGKLNAAGNLSVVQTADLELVMAWHEGAFQFRDTEIRQVLKQLSRWYQVDVDIQLKTEERFFTGRISRNLGLSAVLEILRLSDINFKLEGNKLIVLP